MYFGLTIVKGIHGHNSSLDCEIRIHKHSTWIYIIHCISLLEDKGVVLKLFVRRVLEMVKTPIFGNCVDKGNTIYHT